MFWFFFGLKACAILALRPGMEPALPALRSCNPWTAREVLSFYFFQCQWFLAVVQPLSGVWFFTIPWTASRQASLSITNSRSLVRLMSIESMMPSNHLVLCRPLLLLPSIFPTIRIFSNESTLCIRWPKYWSFWEIFWKDYSWSFPQHGKGNSQSSPRGAKSPIQGKPKQKHAKTLSNQTNKD